MAGEVDGTGLTELQERRWLAAVCLTVAVEQTRQAGLMDGYLGLKTELNRAEFVSTMEKIAAQQD